MMVMIGKKKQKKKSKTLKKKKEKFVIELKKLEVFMKQMKSEIIYNKL